MPREPLITVQADGVEEAAAMLEGIAFNLGDLRAAESYVDSALNQAYRQRWAEWGGFLRDSGRLERSFTSDQSGDALRTAHHDSIEFGSTVPYARFWGKALLDLSSRDVERLAEGMADYFALEDRSGRHPLAARHS